MVAAATHRVTYAPRGAARQLLGCRAFEVLLEGPVGTGKTYGLLWKAHLLALKYAGMRGILLRKTQKSLTESAVQTYLKILETHPARYGVGGFSGNIEEPRSFRYPNGSRLVVGGLDNPGKVMSSEYDFAAIFEATEVGLEDVEAITTRLRNGVMPYQQLVMDCNPGAPSHWLNQRAIEGKTTRLLSRHRDNPRLWDADRGDWTMFGHEYVVERLSNLTGVRRKRLLDGIWAAAEGQVYDGWDPAIHLVEPFDIPYSWDRIWTIDFGYVHPFVWQWWAIGPDGLLVLYREIYMTRRLVADHAREGLALSQGEPLPIEVITDHDAEDRATFERETGFATEPAIKAVSPGIQAVSRRLNPPAGPPRIQIFTNALVEIDQELKVHGRPTSTADEFESYVWDTRMGRQSGEKPVKDNDHGMDTMRYTVAYVDDIDASSGDDSELDAYMDRQLRRGR